MKITKTQLKQIIKEELKKELDEGAWEKFKSMVTPKKKEAERLKAIVARLPVLPKFPENDILKALKVIANSEKPEEIRRLHRAMNAMEVGKLEQAKQLLDNLIKNIPALLGLVPSIRKSSLGDLSIRSPSETKEVAKQGSTMGYRASTGEYM